MHNQHIALSHVQNLRCNEWEEISAEAAYTILAGMLSYAFMLIAVPTLCALLKLPPPPHHAAPL